jgi:glycolate dehydrogenase FAD-binding subunit
MRRGRRAAPPGANLSQVWAMTSAAPRIEDRILSLIGANRVRLPTDSEVGAVRAVVEPESIEEIVEIVRKCEADKITLAPIGAARTLSQIRLRPVALGISLARMQRIIAHEPEDMTVVAQTGISLGELNRELSSRLQRLPLDPVQPQTVTLGALIGAAKAGPLRLSEGLVRDLLIGIQFVGHSGRIARAGGRVVKNVAGYDLMKVLTGSFGTLGIITEATFKIRPIPERYALAFAPFDNTGDAFSAAAKINDATALAHLEVLSASSGSDFGHANKFILMAGFEGNQEEIDYQRGTIGVMLEARIEVVDGFAAKQIYERMRDREFAAWALVAQIAVLPVELPRCLIECGTEFVAHAGSGVARIAMDGIANAQQARETVARWRKIARSARGHVRVLSAPRELREGLAIFDQPNEGALKLMRRLKASFDPAGVFNFGCFVGGI